MIEIKLSYAHRPRDGGRGLPLLGAAGTPAEAKQGVHDPAELERMADELDDEQAASRFICTSDPDEAVEGIQPYLELGFRHLVFHSPAARPARLPRALRCRARPRLRAL